MQDFQDTFETRKQSFSSAFSICMTVPLMYWCVSIEKVYHQQQLL